MNIKKQSVSVIERIILAVIAALIGSVVFALSAQAQEGTTVASTTATTPAPVMGPAAPVGNVVELPRDATANCFNVYRDDILIAECIKPRIATATGHWYFDDSSPEIKPATRFTYSVSAVNDTGESPRLYQTEEK